MSVPHALAGSVLMAGLVLTAGAGTAARQFALPTAAAKALDAQWSTWSVATLEPGATSCAADATPIVTLDVNGDGQQDIAVIVRTPDGVRLVALLRRLDRYELVDVEGLGAETADGHLAGSRRGSTFANPGTGQTDVLTMDAITVLRCGQPTADLYQWYGFRFMKLTVPRTAGAPLPA